MSDKEWTYTEVSSGRYLCSEHGAFCDASDNYLKCCPICDPKKPEEIFPNPVQRTIRIVNGLQDRSKRNLALSSSVFGGLSVLKLVQTAVSKEEAGPPSIFFFDNSPSAILVTFTAIFLLAAIALFAASMSQIPVVEKDVFPSRTLNGWTNFFSKRLGQMEWRHKWAGRFFVLSVICFGTLVFSQSAGPTLLSYVCALTHF
ncbi:hypothetical protein [Ruegeria atlantica]|uniref:hypothetical protein n=1 Tax=Ruegeria atlantica TaxID=81569 RepID=UPI002493DD91|nr:hypothetical protein [Ruegeria atlantica]